MFLKSIRLVYSKLTHTFCSPSFLPHFKSSIAKQQYCLSLSPTMYLRKMGTVLCIAFYSPCSGCSQGSRGKGNISMDLAFKMPKAEGLEKLSTEQEITHLCPMLSGMVMISGASKNSLSSSSSLISPFDEQH